MRPKKIWLIIFVVIQNLAIKQANTFDLENFVNNDNFDPQLNLSRINLNICVDPVIQGEIDHFLEISNRESMEIAVRVLDKVINSQEFYTKLDQLSQGNAVLRVNRRVRSLRIHRNDPIVERHTPIGILEHIREHQPNAEDVFHVTAYEHLNPLSTEVATTGGNTLRFNNRKFPHTVVELVGTLLHERLHYFGFRHELLSLFGLREKRVPYYFGDLIQYLLSGLSQQQAATVFGINYPAGISWS